MQSHWILITSINLRVGSSLPVASSVFMNLIDLATLLHGFDGILVANQHITRETIRTHLASLSTFDSLKLDSLFNPKNPQNVPKAVTLLSGIHELSIQPGFAALPETR